MDSQNEAVRWLTTSVPPYENAPAWAHDVAVTGDGVVYVASIFGANDLDSITTEPGRVLWADDKMFVRADWVIEQCPSASALCATLKRTALSHCARTARSRVVRDSDLPLVEITPVQIAARRAALIEAAAKVNAITPAATAEFIDKVIECADEELDDFAFPYDDDDKPDEAAIFAKRDELLDRTAARFGWDADDVLFWVNHAYVNDDNWLSPYWARD
jgi:hypothetical protein